MTTTYRVLEGISWGTGDGLTGAVTEAVIDEEREDIPEDDVVWLLARNAIEEVEE
jgi:hypothetical protein